MQFIKPDVNINFTGKRKMAFLVSIAMILVSISSIIIHKGPKYGVDFAGGTLVQVKFIDSIVLDDIKSGLYAIGLKKSSVQMFGENKENEFLIRTDMAVMTSEGFSEKVAKALKASTGTDVEIRRVEMVGPQVGKDLREKAWEVITAKSVRIRNSFSFFSPNICTDDFLSPIV